MLRRMFLVIVLIAAARVAAAQPASGGEFRVNTFTTSHQNSPSVAADADGNFVVVWTSYTQDGSGHGVFGQRFDRFGKPRGGEFAVNTFTTSYQYHPEVAVHSSGSFVIVWAGGGDQDGDSPGVFARPYAASGSALRPEIRVNDFLGYGGQKDPDVAQTAVRDFVVVWQSLASDGHAYGVVGRRFNALGDALAPEFLVNTFTTGNQWLPAVATTPSGQFVVVWMSQTQDGNEYGVFGRRFDAAGSPLGSEFQVNTYTTSAQTEVDVAVDGTGNFVVVWQSLGQDGSFDGIFGQRFDAAGNRLGGEFKVNTHTTDHQRHPSVAREADGHFVVTWGSNNQAGPSGDVFAQRFDAGGAKVGAEFQVNAHTPEQQRYPVLASLGAERFVVTWDSEAQDGSSFGIFGRLYGDLIFRDGFDTASTP